MKRRVLIVSPHFPPVNAPDMQRVRMALPHLRELGWEPTVLAVEPELIEGATIEPELTRTYPADVRVIRVGGVSARWTRPLGIGNLGWRCGPALRCAGARLLARERFDLAFFSTTQFGVFPLAFEWRRRFGLPYVLDYQDPWVTDYYARTRRRPPGGPLRFALSQWSARRSEPRVLRAASGVVAVSPEYGPMLQRLYPWFDARQVEVLPFGASANDFALAQSSAVQTPAIEFDPACVHHVYVGRCGDAMALPLRVLFRAFARYLAEAPAAARRHRLHFIGTDYAPPSLARDSVKPIAEAEGVGAFVLEQSRRIPYLDALRALLRADGLLGIGSDDAGYSPSKLYPYLLAARPLLLLYPHGSSPLTWAEQLGAGVRIGFDRAPDPDALADQVWEQWFRADAWRGAPLAPPSAMDPWTAPALTRRLVTVFARALARAHAVC